MLVVDDSLSMRHVLSLAVKKAGWIPVPARDGVEALDVLHRSPRPPDLVLLDIEMPRMDGFEFLSTVRSQKGRADLPIVMLTSRSGDKHRDKAHGARRHRLHGEAVPGRRADPQHRSAGAGRRARPTIRAAS